MEREQDYDRPPVNVSGKEQFLTWLGLVTGSTAIFFLWIFLRNKPFGLQITALVGYSGLTFFQVFCDSRAFKGYSLRLPAVRRKLPDLLVVHLGFLLLVFVVFTSALSVRPHLSPAWNFHDPKHPDETWLDVLLIFAAPVVCMGETYTCRGILRRSIAAENGTETDRD